MAEQTPEEIKAAEQKAAQEKADADAKAKLDAENAKKKPGEKKEELVKIRMKSGDKLKRQIVRPYIGKQWELYAGKEYTVPKHVQEALASMGYLEVV